MTAPAHGLIGGTDVPRILGIAPYGGPIDAYRRIREGYKPPVNDAMRRGLRLEPVVRAIYVDETGAELLPKLGYLKSKRYEFMAASLDDMAQRDGERLVVEYKTAGVNTARQWGESGSDQVPDHYRVQVAWYLACTDLQHADLGCLICGDDFRLYRIVRDLDTEAMLLEACEKFWRDYILPGKPPPPDASESYGEWLHDRYPSSTGPMLSATPEAERWASELRAARLAKEAAEEVERSAKNRLMALIGEADGVEGDGWRITYRSTKGRAAVDWSAVCLEAKVPEDIVKRNTNHTPYRVFRPSFKESKP